MFFRFIFRALEYRKQRLILAFAALAIAATLATVLFGIYGTIESRIREEFRSYGANIVALPSAGKTLPLGLAAAAEALGAQAAPYLITSGRVGSRVIPVAGFVEAKTAPLRPYWKVHGTCLAGENLRLPVGTTAALEGAPCTVTGVLSTGGAEDNELLIPFETAAKLAGLANVASVIEIRAPGDRVEPVRAALAKQFPGADVRTRLSVADTETSVVLKIRASLLLLTLFILGITTLCVSSSFSEMVIERAKEIGIMKALGAAERRIAAFFVSESAALAIAATLAGYLAGLFAAAAIGSQIFGGVFHLEPDWRIFLSVGLVMLTVAAVATGIAVARIWTIEPAIILRGE